MIMLGGRPATRKEYDEMILARMDELIQIIKARLQADTAEQANMVLICMPAATRTIQ